MNLIFTTQGTDWESAMDPRFGRTQFLFVYDEEHDEVQTYDNTASGNEAQGAGLKTAQKLSEFEADVLITGNGPGRNAAEVLKISGIEVYMNAGNMTVREAYNAYRNGDLLPA